MEIELFTNSQYETRDLGRFLAPLMEPGDVILLKGDLGAGKTTFAGGMGEGLGIKDPIISPTFNIMKCYFNGRLPLYHIDAYRLEGQNIEIGLEEYIEGDGVCLIEWPVFIEPLLPDNPLSIDFRNAGGDKRSITVSGEGPRWRSLLDAIRNGGLHA